MFLPSVITNASSKQTDRKSTAEFLASMAEISVTPTSTSTISFSGTNCKHLERALEEVKEFAESRERLLCEGIPTSSLRMTSCPFLAPCLDSNSKASTDRLAWRLSVQSTAARRPNMSQLVPLDLDQTLPSVPYLDDADTMYNDPLFDLDCDPKALDGLPGVPTRTTATLTPTTLRNIEQTFLDLQCQEETHQNQAGFVPPVVQPISHVNGLFMSVVDHKSWGGGSTVIGVAADSHSSNDSSATMRSTVTPPHTHALSITSSAPTRRHTGGRRPIKDKNISPEEEERRQVRRERNKLAAARCRKRRLDHTNELLEETEGLEDKKQSLQHEIQQLQMEKDELEFILETHKANCRLSRAGSPQDIKPFCKVLLTGVPIKEDPEFSGPAQKKPARPRPTSLPVTACNPRSKVLNHGPATIEQLGVPITTPTAGMPFNFESLMDGGTGLTPVSGPLVPSSTSSCGTQQRTGCIDLSSPDAVSTKLVSL